MSVPPITSAITVSGVSADTTISRQQWKWTGLASMASYIDAGSIVAGAAGLALWRHSMNLSSFTVGLLGAISANALSAAVGSSLGGRLGARSAWSIADGEFTLEIEVPVGASAEVLVPTDKPDAVQESGHVLAEVPVVSDLVEVPGGLRCTVPSGRYRFTAPAREYVSLAAS